MTEAHPVLIILGSNIDRERNLPQAVALLGRYPHISLETVSPVYETLPVGGGTQTSRPTSMPRSCLKLA